MLDFKKTEEEILNFWKKNKIYEKVKRRNEKGKKFYFIQGPPYTSGKLHIGHAWNSSLKDMILRYKRMKGFDVWDRAGYDMHGLPTENAVQKKLGLKTKEDIEKYGVEKFVKGCFDFSVEHAEYMDEDLWKLGVWMDYKDPYMPIKKEFIDGEWLLFKKAWEQKRLYKGKKVMHWDAETETSLAKHELEYENVKDTSVFLKFKAKGKKNEYFIVWTTTPWTILFNLAIMVNPELKYVKAKVGNEYWIVAKDLAGVFISGLLGKKFEVVEEFNGEKLEGREYEHFFEDEIGEKYRELKKKYKRVHSIILSKEYVDTSAGTGLVHCAPGCGPEDQEAAEKYGIGVFNTLNERGEFENAGKYTGWKAKQDDYKFIEEFEKKGVLIEKTIVEHEYPHSWRSHKPVIFRTTEQWFLKTSDLIRELLKYNKKVRWVPERFSESYNKWTENLKDNGVTRQRYWGCPVPIWVNEKNRDDYIVLGSVKELEKYAKKKLSDLDLHKPKIDEILIKKDGKTYKRIEDVADVWLDSGTVLWNSLYNDPKLIKRYFPGDLVLEATEQTRLWFSMLQMCSAIVFGKSAYENVFVTGMILDFQGTKMSKSLGNVISPYEVIDKYSADILRYYISQATAGENINFTWDDVKTKQRNLVILENIANYILDLERQKISKGKSETEDKWMLSKYNSALKKIEELFENYRLDEVIIEIENLYISLSKDYIKLIRERASENFVVLETIKEIYLGILKIFSTICPFITDYLWQKMGQKEESVHLSSWPKCDKKKINERLEADFVFLRDIIERGLAERDKSGIGLRWPLGSVEIIISNKVFGKEYFPEDYLKIIKNQLNVKDVKVKKKDNTEISVKFDTTMNEELEAEGYVREFARKIQAERKNAGLKKGQLIALKVNLSGKLKDMLQKHLSFIQERTNSRKIEFTDGKLGEKEIEFKIKEEKISVKFS